MDASKVASEVEPIGRLPTLDGWRAIAILSVLCVHLRWPGLLGHLKAARYFDGVNLFFALSGFLITTRLLEEFDVTGAISWRNFYIRRAFRILPPAFLTLAVLALLGPALHIFPVKTSEIVASVFFYRNYVINGEWYTGHFWSLAVEEHFYLLWPAVLSLVGVARGARAALLLTGVFTLWRHASMYVDQAVPPLANIHRTDYRISGLFWGCAIAFLWRNQGARRVLTRVVRSWWSLPIIAAIIVLARFSPHWSARPWVDDGLDVLVATLPVITVADPRGIVSRVLQTRLLSWIGRLSYSLYLWQQLFNPLPYEPKSLLQQLPFNLVAAFLVASFSYQFIERPCIAFGRRLADVSPVKVSAS
jgi:peptidoglycan/LPS O-acetylase OafA/YrhL